MLISIRYESHCILFILARVPFWALDPKRSFILNCFWDLLNSNSPGCGNDSNPPFLNSIKFNWPKIFQAKRGSWTSGWVWLATGWWRGPSPRSSGSTTGEKHCRSKWPHLWIRNPGRRLKVSLLIIYPNFIGRRRQLAGIINDLLLSWAG